MADPLSVYAFCAKYQLDRHTVYQLIRRQEVHAFRVARKWMIEDPGATFRPPSSLTAEEFVDDYCFIRAAEVASFLGVGIHYVKELAVGGKLAFKWVGHRRLYPFSSVMERLRQRAKTLKPRHKSSLRAWVLKWMQERYARQVIEGKFTPPPVETMALTAPPLEELRATIDEISQLPEPERTEVWVAFFQQMQRDLKVTGLQLSRLRRPAAPLAHPSP